MLIYISGSGRSGSTLLERILHSSPDVVGLGEFHCLWRLPRSQIRCGCAASFDADPFWREALMYADIGEDKLATLRHLEREVARFGTIRASGYSLDRLRQNPQVQQTLDLQFGIFEAVSVQSGADILVDSSKAGPRAWLLATDPRVRVVHLYRRPEDVIASWRSRKFDPGLGTDMQRLSVGRAAIDWAKPEHLIRRLSHETGVIMLDYEQLCRAPQQTVAGLLHQLRLGHLRLPAWLDENQFAPHAPHHSLNGNPDRFQSGPVRIASRRTSLDRLGMMDRVLAPVIGSGLRSLYPAPGSPGTGTGVG